MKRTFALFAVIIAALAGLVGVLVAGVLASGGSSTAQETRARVIEGDVDYAASVDDLITRSTLIVFGVPTGKPTFTVQTETGLLGDYVQSVRVVDVLRGEAPREIQVVRMGLDEERAKEGVDIVYADPVAGPLPTRPVVLFLKPSARPDAYSVVGYTQGTVGFPEDAESVGASARSDALEYNGFEELRGLSIAELKERVAAVKN